MERNNILISVFVGGRTDVPVCRRVSSRVGTVVVGKSLGTKRTLPSVEKLTGSLRVDILAIRGSCSMLRGSNFVRAATKGKYFMSIRGRSFCLRRRRGGVRGCFVRTVRVTGMDKVGLSGLRSLLTLLCRRR